MSPLPTPARASIGLAAVAVSAARELPRKIVELPVIAVGSALQVSLRAQQEYAALIAKGDEILSQLHGIPEEPPSWATFDDSAAGEPATGAASQAADLAEAIEEEAMAELLEAEALAVLEEAEAESIAEALDTATLAAEEAPEPPKGKTAAKRAPAKTSALPVSEPAALSEPPPEGEPPAVTPDDAPFGGDASPTGVDLDPPRV